jgi:hypothetical protein
MNRKSMLILLLLVITAKAFSQGSSNLINSKFIHSPSDSIQFSSGYVSKLPTWGLYGIGNLNTEAFKNINSSGKLSGFIRPYIGNTSYGTLNFGFNVNATNNDSLLTTNFLFPDVGQNSFFINGEWSKVSHSNTSSKRLHINSFFIELALKSIRGRNDDSTRFFNTLNWTVGHRYQFLFKQDESTNVSFSVSPYFSIVNVPDEDNEDYRYLFTKNINSPLRSSIRSLGVKFAFQYNNFQFFADLKQVLGNSTKIPIRELRGFNSNIGVIFNAEIFEK